MSTTKRSTAIDTEPEPPAILAEHLVRLPGTEQWALWKWVGLRGAGFAADSVLALASGRSAAAADELLTAEAEAEEAWEGAVDTIRAELQTATGLRRELLVKALRQLKNGKVPRPAELQDVNNTPGPSSEVVTKLKEFESAYNRVSELGANFEQQYADGVQKSSEALQAAAGSERFREAIIWQNRRALHTGIDSLLHKSSATTSSKYRQHQELAASYLQRYCVKNDSIGFFGPVGWARLSPATISLNLRPGHSFLASRRVYFEAWTIDALCQRFAQDEAFRPWLAPLRLPFVRLEGQKLYVSLKEEQELSAGEASVLAACDGQKSAKSIAGELLANHRSEFVSETQVYELLKGLHDDGVIAWPAGIPYGSHPEESLRSQLEAIADEGLRERALAVLDELEIARDVVAAAADDPAELDEAFSKLEETFIRLTNVASTRAEGRTYAGRTLVYEDCQRNVEVEIGASILESLGAPLSLLLHSARWLTFQVAEECRQSFHDIYAGLVQEKQSARVAALDFWPQVQRFLFGSKSVSLKQIPCVFQERWTEIFSLPEGQRRVSYSSEQLRSRVLAAFDVPGVGWQYARYHSPDIMIAAESVAAIQRGDYQVVMGELHVAIHSLSWSFFLAQHPAPAELFQGIDADLPAPRVLLRPPKSWPGVTSRNFNTLASPRDYPLEYAVDSTGGLSSRALSIASLVLEDKGSGLVVSTYDGQLQFDVIEVFADLLSTEIVDWFKLFKAREHTPRVSIDRLVVQRESWSVPASEIAFAFERLDADRFLEARRFRQQHQMPRHVFCKVPVEVKPVYVDFDSAIYVNMLAKLIRRSVEKDREGARVTVSEMLPGMQELWLEDGEGQRYTSEFRIVALDLCEATEC